MAVKYVIDDETMTQIAGPLRSLAGRTDELTPAEMAVVGNSAASEVGTQSDLIAQISAALEGKASPSGGITPTGTIKITENGTHDVTNYASAEVNVPTGSGGDTDIEDGLVTRSLTSYTNDRVTSIGADFFYSNTTIQSVSFPKATSVGTEAFRACSKLTSVNFPETVTIGQHAFRNSVKLAEVVFPKATSVGGYAFREDTALVKADFSKITSVAAYVFYGCTALTALILRNQTAVSLGSTNAFTNTPIASGTGYIYVPSALVNTYKAETNWSSFAAQFRAIEDYPNITGG